MFFLYKPLKFAAILGFLLTDACQAEWEWQKRSCAQTPYPETDSKCPTIRAKTNLLPQLEMTIAVDFDGTIVENRYPHIGKERPFAVETLKMLARDRHRLILWTVREGKLLEDAVEWCRERGVEFYAVNKDYPEEGKQDQWFSRKVKADLFIDDRNVGGLPDWGDIYRMVKERITAEQLYEERNREEHEGSGRRRRKRGFLGFRF